MSEIKFRYKFDSTAYVVDEAYFLKMERMAKMNGEKIEKLAEKKFRNYLNDGMNPIKLEFRIRGVEELVGHSVITELNYGERGYPMSVPERIKYEAGYNFSVCRYTVDCFAGTHIENSPFDSCVSMIKWLIAKGYFSKEYLCNTN